MSLQHARIFYTTGWRQRDSGSACAGGGRWSGGGSDGMIVERLVESYRGTGGGNYVGL